jgi:septal ring factor EnvC (AmiA/AmiB activator)
MRKAFALAAAVMKADEADVEAARKAYPRLVEMESTDPARVKELREVMRVLHKSADDLVKDAEAIAAFRAQQAVARNGRGMRAERDAQQEKLRAANEERQRKIQELNDEGRTLAGNVATLDGYVSAGEAALIEMRKLRERHLELLAGETVPNDLDEPAAA